jgi:glucoamylase
VVAVLCTLVVAVFDEPWQRPVIPALHSAGIATAELDGVVAVPPRTAVRYVVGTSLLEPVIPIAGAAIPLVHRIQAERAWLASGRPLAEGSRYRGMYERALLDLRCLTLRNGAFLAAMGPGFGYVWPRDASFAAAAFSATDHHGDAERILRFLAGFHPADGRWQARYLPDGSGRVPDDRGVQLDGGGWIAWSTWFWYSTVPDQLAARPALEDLWPMVERSADRIAAALQRGGLPPPSADYWERDERKTTLGTVAPLLAGLRAAADLARQVDRTHDAARWAEGARRLDAGIRRTFRAHGYPRTLPAGGADAAVTFVAAPFAETDPAVAGALATAASRLRVSNGGLEPGERWRRDGTAWTPATSLFSLAFAAAGNRGLAQYWLDWLAGHRTTLGALPERVDTKGRPVSVAPLGWTAAVVVLAIRALEDDLPVPPAR